MVVAWQSNSLASLEWLVAQAVRPDSPLSRLPPQLRARLLAALAAFVILGLGMMALVWLGARVTRRYMNQEPLRRRDPVAHADDWAARPLSESENEARSKPIDEELPE